MEIIFTYTPAILHAKSFIAWTIFRTRIIHMTNVLANLCLLAFFIRIGGSNTFRQYSNPFTILAKNVWLCCSQLIEIDIIASMAYVLCFNKCALVVWCIVSGSRCTNKQSMKLPNKKKLGRLINSSAIRTKLKLFRVIVPNILLYIKREYGHRIYREALTRLNCYRSIDGIASIKLVYVAFMEFRLFSNGLY